MKNYCIIDTSNQKIVQKLKEYGYVCIPTENSMDVSGPISLHADVLYLKTDNNSIYISECQKNNFKLLKDIGYNVNPVKLSAGYKTECKLNMVITDDIVLCNHKTCMEIYKDLYNKKIIYTNQGYTKCSTVVIGNDNFITEDESIYNSLINIGKNCLLIDKGQVRLDGYDYGFIGGASIYLPEKNTVLFFGDITAHTSYSKIDKFIKNCNKSLDYIDNMCLCDIGGGIIL